MYNQRDNYITIASSLLISISTPTYASIGEAFRLVCPHLAGRFECAPAVPADPISIILAQNSVRFFIGLTVVPHHALGTLLGFPSGGRVAHGFSEAIDVESVVIIGR